MKNRRSPDWIALAWSGFVGLLVWLALPWMVIVMDDDFWYLRSVVETLRRGWPWTDEWLTPWAASTSALVASLFKLTGSFQFSVHFSLALAAALAAAGITLHLRDSGFGRPKAILTSGLLLLSPTVLFMFLMFTSVALYMGCLWMCVLMAGRRQWGGFFLFWVVGIAARQSAITWLGLAAWPVIAGMWRRRTLLVFDRSLRGPLAVLVGGAIVVVALKVGMNRTHAQEAVLGAVDGHLSMRGILKPLMLGGLALCAGYGLACLLSAVGCSPRPPGNVRRWFWLAAPALVVAGVIGANWFRVHTLSTHGCFKDPWAAGSFGLAGAAAALGVALRPVTPRWDALLVALGALVLLALYGTAGDLFDYHCSDTFFWGFAAALAPGPAADAGAADLPGAASWTWRAIRMLSWTLLGLLAIWNARCFVRLKLEQDRLAGACVVYEKALRSGSLTAQQISSLPFGYIGWRLSDYYADHEGAVAKQIGGFVFYADQWDGHRGTGIVVSYDKPLRAFREWLPTHNNKSLMGNTRASIRAEVRTPLLWFFGAKHALKRLEGDGRAAGRPAVRLEEYRPNPFPLNDHEWREHISRPR